MGEEGSGSGAVDGEGEGEGGEWFVGEETRQARLKLKRNPIWIAMSRSRSIMVGQVV